MTEHAQRSLFGSIQTSDAAGPYLAGAWLRLARVVWVILALASLGILVTALPAYALRMSGQLGHVSQAERTTSVVVFAALSGLASLASALLSMGLSAVFFRRRFEEPAAAALSFYLLIYAVVMAGPLEGWSTYWLGDTSLALTLQAVLLATPSVALFLLFPNGRFVPSWTRWVLLLTVPWNISLYFLPGFDPDSLGGMKPLELGLLAAWYGSFLLVGLYAQVYRYRKVSTPTERQQTKWVVFGFSLWLTYTLISTVPYLYLGSLPPDGPVPWWASASELGWFLALNIIPVSLTIAVTRYRLWDINLVINRALVYGALTVCVVGIYALIVGAVGTLLQAQGDSIIAFLATGVVAVLFQPLRERLQRGVNRLIYGQRDEPFEVVAHLGRRLEETLSPEMVYPTIVETVAQALKLPYVAIAVKQGDRYETVESYGKPSANLVTYPLTYQTEIVGQLQVAGRSPNDPFTEADELLLRSIAQQAGTAVHAVQLTADLQYSRQRLVTMREEERRRLRRDLHDGLGPTLAAHMLKIGSARASLTRDPAAAASILDELETGIEDTLAEIRRLVYELRPPALDQLGLVGAIEELAAGYEGQPGEDVGVITRNRLHIHVHAPEHLPPLPAAIEVAAYRIVQEGLTNVIRHAQATRCDVVIEVGLGGAMGTDQLRLEISDNGRGMPNNVRTGVGLTSMRERAEEIGGTFAIRPTVGGGTRLIADLPLITER